MSEAEPTIEFRRMFIREWIPYLLLLIFLVIYCSVIDYHSKYIYVPFAGVFFCCYLGIIR